MADFYADENFRYPVVEALRRLGHNVLTCQEAGRANQGVEDPVVLSDAAGRGCILLTQNRIDFIRLHQKGHHHQGIVVCTYDPDTEALARRIDQEIQGQTPGTGWLVRVNRPNPGGGRPPP